MNLQLLDSLKIFRWVLGIILIGIVWLHGANLDTLAWNNDEGIHLSAAQLVSQGHSLYSDVAFSQSPLFLEWIRLSLVWGGSVLAVRQALFLFGILLIIAVAFMGRELKGNIAGWSAAIFLILSPSFFYFARAVMADVPSVALAMWAAWTTLKFYHTGKRPWLIASGILMGLSLLMKFLTIYAVGWIILLICYRIYYIEQKTTTVYGSILDSIQNNLIFLGSTGLIILGIIVWYDIPSLLSSIFGMRLAMRKTFGGLLDSNLDVITEFWELHTPLIILALYGLFAQLPRPHQPFFLFTWLTLLLLSLLNHTPLYPQHLQLLLPVVTILAGIGVNKFVETTQIQPALKQRVWFGMGLFLLGWYISFMWLTHNHINRFTATSPNPLNEQDYALVNFLQEFTAPNDCLITDNMVLAFTSKRFPPPPLIDLSSARLRSQSITYDKLVTATQQYNCQTVIAVNRLKRYEPDFLDWTKTQFLGLWLFNNSIEVRLAQPISNPQPMIPLHAVLGDQMILEGADITESDINQTRMLYVSLYWQPLQPINENYTIFVHLRDANNVVIANGDHQPYNNFVPTSRWPVGNIIKETIRLKLPSGISLDNYRLLVGLYQSDTQERLAIQPNNSGENAVIIMP